MSVKWTDSQKEAIDFRGNSVIVSAAAGSGKTAVLVERIIKITEKVPVDKLLIVTFTKDAASQMRRKISDAFYEKMTDETLPNDVRTNYQTQLMLLPNSLICTIDSLCSKIVKENFEKLGISLNFSVLDPSEAEPLFNDCLERFTERLYDENDKDLLKIADAFLGYNNDTKLLELIKEIYYFAQKSAFPEKALSGLLKTHQDPDILNQEWIKLTTHTFKNRLNTLAQKYEFETNNLFLDKPDFGAYTILISDDLEQLSYLSQIDDYDEIYNKVKEIKFKTFPTIKALKDAPEVLLYKAIRQNFKTAFSKAVETITVNSLEIKEFLALQKDVLEALVSVVCKLQAEFMEFKKDKNVFEFSDISHFAVSLLCDDEYSPTDIAKKLSESFYEIIIDEYQDTNDIQESILTAISKNSSNLFMVGDMKQSIYRFRNTAPELFNHKVKSFTNDGKGAGKRIYLNQNFRSRENILSFTNLIFEQTMCEDTGEILYEGPELLKKGATYYEGDDPEVLSVVLNKPDSKDNTTDIQCEALQTAYEITKLMSENTLIYDTDLKQQRPVKYSDISVLLRNAKNIAEVFADVLTKSGIPVINDNSDVVLLDSTEVSVILNYLRIIDNPYQDIALVSVLRSAFFGFDDSFLVKIKKTANQDRFFDCLQNFSGSDEENQKVTAFLQELDKFKVCSRYLSVRDVLENIDISHNYSEYLLSMPGGAQRLSNLNHLKLSAEQFEVGEFKGLFSFLRHIDRIKSAKSQPGAPKIFPENTDAVKITTIHKSKGLEYPVVIIPCLGKENFKDIDAKKFVLLHKKIGVGIDYTDFNNNFKIASPLKQAIKLTNKLEHFAEEMRILYVALTRAREKLILIGSVKNKDDFIKSLEPCGYTQNLMMPAETVLGFSSSLKLIFGALYRTSFFYEYKTSETKIIETSANVKIKFLDSPETFEITKAENISSDKEKYNKEVFDKLDFTYPKAKSELFLKYSVSNLKKFDDDLENPKEFFEPESTLLTFEDDSLPVTLGNVFHFFMEKTDFSLIESIDDVKNALTKMTQNNLITKAEADLIDTDKVWAFLNTPLGKSFKNSSKVYKEKSFNILASDIFKNQPHDIQIQGVIDCYFKVNDEYIILDFKTDRKINDETLKRYKLQLEFYKRAVKIMHKTQNVSAYLYSLNNNEFIKV